MSLCELIQLFFRRQYTACRRYTIPGTRYVLLRVYVGKTSLEDRNSGSFRCVTFFSLLPVLPCNGAVGRTWYYEEWGRWFDPYRLSHKKKKGNICSTTCRTHPLKNNDEKSVDSSYQVLFWHIDRWMAWLASSKRCTLSDGKWNTNIYIYIYVYHTYIYVMRALPSFQSHCTTEKSEVKLDTSWDAHWGSWHDLRNMSGLVGENASWKNKFREQKLG